MKSGPNTSLPHRPDSNGRQGSASRPHLFPVSGTCKWASERSSVWLFKVACIRHAFPFLVCQHIGLRRLTLSPASCQPPGLDEQRAQIYAYREKACAWCVWPTPGLSVMKPRSFSAAVLLTVAPGQEAGGEGGHLLPSLPSSWLSAPPGAAFQAWATVLSLAMLLSSLGLGRGFLLKLKIRKQHLAGSEWIFSL